MLSALQDYGHIEIDQCLADAVPLFDSGWPWSQWNVSEAEPHRPAVCPVPVYDGDPREAPIGFVYPVGNEEFYVPSKVTQGRGTTAAIDARIAAAEKVVRPEKPGARSNPFLAHTSPEVIAGMDFKVKQLSEMSRSSDIAPDVRESLKTLVVAQETPKAIKCKHQARL